MLNPIVTNWFDYPARSMKPVGAELIGDGLPLGSWTSPQSPTTSRRSIAPDPNIEIARALEGRADRMKGGACGQARRQSRDFQRGAVLSGEGPLMGTGPPKLPLPSARQKGTRSSMDGSHQLVAYFRCCIPPSWRGLLRLQKGRQ
jgi:hypothetical protein